MGKYSVGSELTREDMAKLWLTEDLWGQDDRELLVWHHMMNHLSFKYLLRLSKRGIIPRNLSNVRNPPVCRLPIWLVLQNAM